MTKATIQSLWRWAGTDEVLGSGWQTFIEVLDSRRNHRSISAD